MSNATPAAPTPSPAAAASPPVVPASPAAASSPSLLSVPAKGAPEAAKPDDSSAGSTSPATPADTTGAPDGAAQPQAKPDDKASEAPPEEGKAEADAPSEELQLKLPEGFAADKEFLDAFRKEAKELGLKSEGAQKFVDLYASRQQALISRAEAMETQQVESWVAGVKSDPELGGPKFDASIALGNKALGVFATPALEAVLKETGVGCNPEFIRFAKRVGEALREDSIAGGTGLRTPAKSKEDELFELYPSMRPANP